jgi:hypothetical protein
MTGCVDGRLTGVLGAGVIVGTEIGVGQVGVERADTADAVAAAVVTEPGGTQSVAESSTGGSPVVEPDAGGSRSATSRLGDARPGW